MPLFFRNGTGKHAMGLFSAQPALFFVVLIPFRDPTLFGSAQHRGLTAHARWWWAAHW